MFNKYSHVGDLEFDLTSACNSMCPHCDRTIYDESTNMLYTSPFLPSKLNFDLNALDNLLSSNLISEKTHVRLTGTYGDCFLYPDLLAFLDRMYELAPYLSVSIDTNGSSRNEKFIRALLRKLEKFPSARLSFNVDGNEETNQWYRHGTRWKTIERNMRAAVKYKRSCAVTWRCLKFPWNVEMADELDAIANDIGIRFKLGSAREADYYEDHSFKAVKDNRVTRKVLSALPNPPQDFEMDNYSKSKDYIDAECLAENKMFVGFDSRVYVCCGQFGDRYNIAGQAFRRHEPLDPTWNSLKHHTLDNIVKHDFWTKLYESLNTRPYSYCNDMCGKCK